ncbi:MAG TPA: DnaJ domain-containing protein [Thermoanaerobaculia bacterium]|nr:DnaJ domain-containing protein [Thermoanaerobaculia bacterium]
MLQTDDYYTLLGVGREASESEIRERFRALARQAHPDLAPTGEKAEAEARFQGLTEALNVLCNPDRRQAYDRERLLASHGGSVDAVVQDYIEQGNRAYRSGAFAEAAGNFALAARKDPKDARAHHHLGLASARAGDLRSAVKALETAVALDPHNVVLLKDAGKIFRQAGLLSKAEKSFQDAVSWDPAQSDARRALEEVRAERAVKA